MSNTLNEEMSEIIDMEFEALKAIYLEDMTIKMNDMSDRCLATISVDLYPKTGDNIEDQFVKLKLIFKIPKNYPNECPSIDFKNIRGLADNNIQEIESEIKKVFDEKCGESMVYDMIERSRDLLTALNFPIGNRCAICLYHLTANDEVVRNECFHHLHCRCFAYYLASKSGSGGIPQIQCPVCRIELNSIDWNRFSDPNRFSVPYLSDQPLEDETIIIEEAKLNQRKFETIYEKQLKNGGIIDTESQRNKFVLRISQINDQMIVS